MPQQQRFESPLHNKSSNSNRLEQQKLRALQLARDDHNNNSDSNRLEEQKLRALQLARDELKPRRFGKDGGEQQLDEQACDVIKGVIKSVI